MAEAGSTSPGGLTKGARITGDQRSSLAASFGERYAGGESIRSIAIDTGRSYGFVHGVLKESGTSLRGRGGATRGPRRDAAGQVAEQVQAGASGPASAERTKAKAAKKADKAPVVAKAKAKDDKKDDKSKKKADVKKSAKKGKKG